MEDFKKALSQNEVLQEFDRGIFESIIEKVIVGGYDEDGNKDPYKITFIYKTGFRNEVGNAKQRFDKTKSVGDKAKELCSHIADEVKDVCSYVSDNTCHDGRSGPVPGFDAALLKTVWQIPVPMSAFHVHTLVCEFFWYGQIPLTEENRQSMY